MRALIGKYTHWLHTQWPAGTVEKLPLLQEDGTTDIPGLTIVGDLTGIPLLKFSSDTGARAVQRIVNDPGFQQRQPDDDIVDLAIVGAGVSGVAAALEAKKQSLRFALIEASESFSTISNFPQKKPIFTYPTDMVPAGELQFTGDVDVKEKLLDDLQERLRAAEITTEIARVEQVIRSGGVLEVRFGKRPPLKAHQVIVAIGRSGNYRSLGVPGEKLEKVVNRLIDPADYTGQEVLVVGGGDSALEAAAALASNGARVTLSYRKPTFNRPKPENIEQVEFLAQHPPSGGGSLTLMLGSTVREIREEEVLLEQADGNTVTLPNQAVLSLIGREPPLDFFRRSKVPILGEWRPKAIIGLVVFLALCTWVYHWKKSYGWAFFDAVNPKLLWNSLAGAAGSVGAALSDPSTLLGTLRISMSSAGFYYTLLYSVLIVVFGIRRIRRKRTRYIKWETVTLIAIQCLPLFILPEVMLPFAGHNGLFGQRYTVTPVEGARADQIALAIGHGGAERDDDRILDALSAQPQLAGWTAMGERAKLDWVRGDGSGLRVSMTTAAGHKRVATFNLTDRLVYHHDESVASSWLADELFPGASYGNGREYWRAYGFVLAWPLFFSNLFTGEPLTLWLIISLLQTFVLIPLIIRKWGKGAYCGWICSCGAMAETMGDTHRHKMLHGPRWNRANMLGQVFLGLALLLLVLRVTSWILPGQTGQDTYNLILFGKANFSAWPAGLRWLEYPLAIFNYAWFVDLLWAGILGLGLYFHFSGRVWCRFACPLAALMHIYARFTRFRIFADKKKCISCNVCTTVCHQGIDVMGFANKGKPMADPECVRCSSCVYSCPTGVLTFGELDPKTGQAAGPPLFEASPVQMAEKNGASE